MSSASRARRTNMIRLASLLGCLLLISQPAFARHARGGSPFIGSCPVTSGPITVVATTPRSTGISPLLVFFDATGTTYSGTLQGANNPFQDLSYAWTFGDGGTSGTSTWAYGSNPNVNSRNTATGAIAAHLYVTSGADAPYTATVTVTDGTNTAQCNVAVTAYDPGGSNGFVGTNTKCVSASGTPVAGSGGCPSGASVLNTSAMATAISGSQSGKRTLFKCGDTFTANDLTISGTTWSVGAYGGCQGTQTSRPIVNSTSNTISALIVATSAGDGRIADLDVQGAGTGAGCASGANTSTTIPYQITLYNLNCNGSGASYFWAQGAQWGLISSVNTGMTAISVYANYAANNPGVGGWSNGTGPYKNIDYTAVMGNSIDGTGAGNTVGPGIEVMRQSGGSYSVIANNSLTNANNIGAPLKVNEGNTYNSNSTWIGLYSAYYEISDNFFGGKAGSQLMENCAENSSDDERLKLLVVERNVFSATIGGGDGRLILECGTNATVRNNGFYAPASNPSLPFAAMQVASRGIEPVPTGVEAYNNSVYFAATQSGQHAIVFQGALGCCASAPNNSFLKNTLFYSPAGNSATADAGTGNSVTNNTNTTTNNPSFTNGSGNYTLITDFKPTANYSGGTSVPNLYDALGNPWSPTWDLGAVHH